MHNAKYSYIHSHTYTHTCMKCAKYKNPHTLLLSPLTTYYILYICMWVQSINLAVTFSLHHYTPFVNIHWKNGMNIATINNIKQNHFKWRSVRLWVQFTLALCIVWFAIVLYKVVTIWNWCGVSFILNFIRFINSSLSIQIERIRKKRTK